ncbi:MAG: oligosaccharide flippase family protein [Leptolyngbyaceae bacterium]|nr:oligosaccharide flippase family protein [Leptolyngbyaceae bacterium]
MSLKNLAIRGATWTFVGFGAAQVLRFGSNLVLTRLLVPEMFGLMALVNSIMLGLRMFSDVGIGPSIIQDEQGDDPVFLNTAWTMQVIRGLGIWGTACLLAWPVAQFYGEPILTTILPVSALTVLIEALASTSLFTGERHLDMSRLTIIEVTRQVVSIVAMIGLAMVNPSVWSLVIGGICGSLTKTIISHIWGAEFQNRFMWDEKAVQSLVRFGRWIFISTIMAFLLKYGDRLIMGKFLSTSDLGIYSIASMLAGVIEQVLNRVTNKVLFPIYSKLNHLAPEKLRPRVKKVRLAMMGILLPPLWIMAVFGTDLIALMFDPRYLGAGWILQVLAAGIIILVISDIGPFYMAYGNSFLMMKLQAVQSFFLVASMIIGGMFWGANGVIIGISVRHLLFYPVQTSVYRRYSLWLPALDALGFFGSVAIIGLGWWLRARFLV